jgi:lipopolysaccharide/colanic/teichoic acid biosynthesis glycosyltransferase
VTADQWAEVLEVVDSRPSQRAGAVARRGLDLVLTLSFLFVIAPLMLLIAALVRLDSAGPAIYRQRRVGLGGREFEVNKFRSMRSGADSKRHRDYVNQLIGSGADGAEPGEEGLYKLVVDDRITRVGRFLRRWSLDELPQLWNVVRGEMSLVGPRPVIPYEVECYPDWYHARFAVKPGLTGLWQVSGRNEKSYEEMVALDIEYARRRTLWLDLKILVRTALVVLTHRGAA